MFELLECVQKVRRGVAWSEACMVNCWASSMGCRRLKKSWLKSVHRIRIEHVCQSLDKDDESPLV